MATHTLQTCNTFETWFMFIGQMSSYATFGGKIVTNEEDILKNL